MDEKKATTFSGRALVSVLTAAGFLALALTGVMLYVTPPGRVAHWTGWRLLGLTKEQWGALHICFGTLFLIASGFHIYYNWRPLMSYFKSRVTRQAALRKEWALAVLVFLAVWVGVLAEAPPFSTVMALNDRIKNSWEEPAERAPIPHAELLTIMELAEEAKVELATMLANLKAKGIEATGNEIVGDLAKEQGMTPQALFRLATGSQGSGRGKGGGGGRGMGGGGGRGMGGGGGGRGMGGGRMGQKTLEQFCADEGLDLAATLEKLKAMEIEVSKDTKLHEIAQEHNIRPYELLEKIRTP